MTDLQRAMQLARDEEQLAAMSNLGDKKMGSWSEQTQIEAAKRLASGGSMSMLSGAVSKSFKEESHIERCARLAREANPVVYPNTEVNNLSIQQLRSEAQAKQQDLYLQRIAVSSPSQGPDWDQAVDSYYRQSSPEVGPSVGLVMMGRTKTKKRILLVERMTQPIM